MRAYTADMIPGGASPVINVSQYDNDYAVTVTLIEGAEIYTPPAGATIRVEGTKPDGHGFEYACTYQGNVVTMPIYTQMTAVAGRFPIELVVYQSGLRVGSCNIIFAVERAPLGDNTDISETVIPDIIAGAQAQADAAAASATEAASSAASAETAKTAAMDAAQDAIDAAQELQTAIQFNAALIHDTASGAVASFADGADNIPMQSVVADITPVQSGSGDPSPTNVRPISGRTRMTVTRAGKNLLEMFGKSGTYILSKNTFVKAGTYTASANGISGNYATYVRKATTEGSASGDVIASKVNSGNITFTLEEDTDLMMQWYAPNDSSADLTGKTFQLELGSTATDYEPYAGQTIPVTWESTAGTVYGGTLDVVSGVLTVDRAIYTGTWAKHPSYNTVFNTPAPETYNYCPYQYANCYCNCLPAQEKGTTLASLNNTTQFRASDRLYASVQNITTLADFQAWAETNELQLCYQLATPQTYQLTPTEVRTLLGGNTIFTDAGDVSVEYIADTKLYIDNKIAELQALVLEN